MNAALATTSQAQFPLTEAILAELAEQMPFLHRATLTGSVSLETRLPFVEDVAQRLEELHSASHGGWVKKMVHGYVVLGVEFLKLQRELEKTGRYLLASQREARQRVYDNDEVFGAYYLEGLLLSEVLWPNHHQLNELFRNHFLPRVGVEARVLEVGVGTGYHLRDLLRARPGVDYLGVDISRHAINFASRYALDANAASPQTQFKLEDATQGLSDPAESFDAVVMGEVLEHVENPRRLLTELRRVSKPGAPFFLTTVAFAANIDHLYLFENANQIRELIGQCGWQIETELALPVYPTDTAESHRRPINYGAILRNH